jgi:MYXO-CTERM domain-containing protein
MGRTTLAAAIAAGLGVSGPAQLASAASIGMQFVGSGTALSSSALAGVVAQQNWNALAINASTLTSPALVDSAGASTPVTITGGTNTYYIGGYLSGPPATAGDTTLSHGELNETSANDTITGLVPATSSNSLAVTGITYSQYDVYVYTECDSANNETTVSLKPSGGSATFASFKSESGGTGWTQATGTWNGAGTAPSDPVANYARFVSLTATSFTVEIGGVHNAGINGIEIVNTTPGPEPTSFGLMALGGLLILPRRRRSAY